MIILLPSSSHWKAGFSICTEGEVVKGSRQVADQSTMLFAPLKSVMHIHIAKSEIWLVLKSNWEGRGVSSDKVLEYLEQNGF